MAENGDDHSFPREGRGPNVVLEFEAVAQLLYVLLLLYFERPIIVLTSREMQEPLFRFLSFLGFPRGNIPDIRDFVCAGLYYTGDSDHVYCYCCDFHRFQWVSTDNPFDIHRRYFPNCPFFQRNINVNLNAILNLRRQRGPVLIRFEELPGPTLETNNQGVEHETHRQITSRMSQTEEIFETFNLPPANLPDIERLLGTAPSSFGEIITGATTNRNSRVHNMRRLRNIGHEQGIESEATSTNREENDISNDSDNLLQNFSVSVRCESDGNETFRKTMTGCANDQTGTNFMVPFPSQECSGVCFQPSDSLNCPSVSLSERDEYSITTSQQTLPDNNSSTSVENTDNDYKINIDRICQSNEGKKECGAVATTNVSDGLVFNNHNAQDDDNTQNLEAREQPVKAKADSTKAATTKEAGFLKMNNNDVRVDNLNDDKTHNLEAKCQSVVEKNESGKAAATNEPGVLESNHNDAFDKNHNDDDTHNLEAKDQPVKAKADSAKAETTNESGFLVLNNNGARVKNLNDDKTHNLEVRCQLIKEKNKSRKAAATKESGVLVSNHNDACDENHNDDDAYSLEARGQPVKAVADSTKAETTKESEFLKLKNNDARVENLSDDKIHKLKARCQSVEEKNESGKATATNESGDLVSNHNDACDENHNAAADDDDGDTSNSEARDKQVKAKAYLTKTATTKELGDLELNNNDARDENHDDDNTHNLETRCQSVEEKNESGEAAATNESSVLESNHNDAVDENHLDAAAAADDDDTPNSEARDQPVKAKADSTKAATTKESRDLELNNNDARVDNINDHQTHKLEARCQSVEEKKESGKTEASKESGVLVSNHNDACDENHNDDDAYSLEARGQPVKAVADSTKAKTTKESGFFKLKNNDVRVDNLNDDKTHNLEASCQTIQEKNESGKAAATNESGVLVSNHNDACDENHDDDDAYNFETRDQPVMAKADSTIALITKESDFLELNNNNAHIKNHRDKLNSEARFQSDEENNEFVTAVTTTESPTEKHNETLYSSHEEMLSNTTELIFQEVTRTEHTVMHDEDGEFVCGRPQGNQEVTEISEAISIAENNLQAINSLHSHIQNDEAIHGLPHDSIEGVEETHRQIDKDRNALSSAETDRLPMSNIAAKRDENMNGNEGMVRRQNVCIVSDLGNSNIIDDKTGPQKILHRKTRTGEEASASMEQTDSKRNKAFSPSQTVVLPADEDGSISPRKDSMTAEIGSKKECLTSQTVQLTEVKPERETVDLKEVHTGYHPTATPTTSTHHNEQVTDEEESVAENDGNVISSSVTDKLPMSDIATKREGNRNINEGMLQRKIVGKEKNLEGPQKTVHEKTRTGEEVGATMEQTDSKRNKAFSPTPTVVLPAGGDGAMFSGKDSMTAEIGSKKKCLTSKKAKPLKEEPDRQTVDLKEVHSSHHPTETPTANSENIEDFCMRIRDILAKIDDPLEKSKKQEEIMTILGN